MAEPRKVAVLISGRGTNMRALVEQAGTYEVVLVASNKPEATGLAWARDRGLNVWSRDSRGIDRAAFDAELGDVIAAHNAGTIALAGYMRLLSPQFVERWRGRIVNIHPSLLPAFPGLHTHQRALAGGVKIHGTTVHFVTSQLDHGPIIIQAAVPVLPSDDEDTLARRVLVQEHRIYPQALRWLAENRVVFAVNDVVEIRGLDVPSNIGDQYLLVPKE